MGCENPVTVVAVRSHGAPSLEVVYLVLVERHQFGADLGFCVDDLALDHGPLDGCSSIFQVEVGPVQAHALTDPEVIAKLQRDDRQFPSG